MRRAALAGVAAALIVAAPAPARERLERIGRFAQPVYVTSPPHTARTLAVVERYGRVRELRDGRVLRRPLVDLRARVLVADPDETVDQRGLLSLAFAPDYARSRRLYVMYVDRSGRLRVDEWRRHARAGRRVLDLGPAPNQHHGGQLQFGPDGRLYVSTGMGDVPSVSQDPAAPGGKILRLDPRARPPRPEVVALGLRNPWRFSFAAGGVLLIGDVGGDLYEEIDVLAPGTPRGANFGWPLLEGHQRLAPGDPPGYVAPAAVLAHSDGWCSVVGGYATRGRYVFGDVCSGRLWSARLAGARLGAPRRLRLTVPYLVSFGRDRARRLYAVSLNGEVLRVTRR
jgi:glucose/arabinose dehydrogenase